MRSVLALDGEGITDGNGNHYYTLLLGYDSHSDYQRSTYIEDYSNGLTTGYIFRFLTHLTKRSRIICGFYLNYDIAKWIEGFSDSDKTVLWKSGWVIWKDDSYAGSNQCYYVRYIPSKMFFVGEWVPDIDPTKTSMRKWPLRHILIYDVSGFFQCSFVQALREWQKQIGISARELVWIRRHKRDRSNFTSGMATDTRKYCERECYWLCCLVSALAETFEKEEVRINGWYGAGAVGSFYLKKWKVDQFLSDTTNLSDDSSAVLQTALLSSYYGGRNEVCAMGRLHNVFDYDVNSAYPAAILELPDLVHGHWEEVHEYNPHADFAVWHVTWDLRDYQLSLAPFPFRRNHGVYYPDAGSGWYHACELQAALCYYGGREGAIRRSGSPFQIDRGWIYTAESAYHPFGFVHDLAAKRVWYKRLRDPRAIPYKYALNSLYGKLAQHATTPGRKPTFQSYAAAGYVTARTRARLLHFIFQWGAFDFAHAAEQNGDVVMIATDGVFCTRERTQGIGSGLGEWEAPTKKKGIMADGYIIQPGVWYGKDGISRTRGFYAHSLDYKTVQSEWQKMGPYGLLSFTEKRFVGIGQCAGRGDYTEFGKWITCDRELQFYPERKYPGKWEGESLHLYPMDMNGMEAEPFKPPSTQDESYAWESLHNLEITLMLLDDPEETE